MKFEELKIILKRLYREYIKKHLNKILIALILSLLSTLYPAWRASKIEPANILRYE